MQRISEGQTKLQKKTSTMYCTVRSIFYIILLMHLIPHTAPEWCQPEKFATLSFSAFLVICDQDKKLQVGQQIL